VSDYGVSGFIPHVIQKISVSFCFYVEK
jgi:hypothetical protein